MTKSVVRERTPLPYIDVPRLFCTISPLYPASLTTFLPKATNSSRWSQQHFSQSVLPRTTHSTSSKFL